MYENITNRGHTCGVTSMHFLKNCNENDHIYLSPLALLVMVYAIMSLVPRRCADLQG